ncbi:DUF5988 family protein [Micromonospora sp. DT31]|uniref:DUF5988 family protein n=1 Tax=Micromonospora sp. DT31 TaxID=3393434 RepID=UPI003CF437C8
MSAESMTPRYAQSIVEAILEGGPANLPEDLRVRSVTRGVAKVKLEHLGGYEHFERCEGASGTAEGPVVFRWTMRTRIAE